MVRVVETAVFPVSVCPMVSKLRGPPSVLIFVRWLFVKRIIDMSLVLEFRCMIRRLDLRAYLVTRIPKRFRLD